MMVVGGGRVVAVSGGRGWWPRPGQAKRYCCACGLCERKKEGASVLEGGGQAAAAAKMASTRAHVCVRWCTGWRWRRWGVYVSGACVRVCRVVVVAVVLCVCVVCMLGV